MKRLGLGVILAMALLAGSTSPALASKGCGDVRKDGVVNSVDALVILQVVTGLYDPGLILLDQWDLDNDAAITSVDALIVLQYVVGLVPELPDCYA